MQPLDLENELRDLKRRVDLAETKLAQQAGQFEFISGQLRDVQLYMHARFEDVDRRFVSVERRLDGIDRKIESMDRKIESIDAKIDALPRVIVELISSRN